MTAKYIPYRVQAWSQIEFSWLFFRVRLSCGNHLKIYHPVSANFVSSVLNFSSSIDCSQNLSDKKSLFILSSSIHCSSYSSWRCEVSPDWFHRMAITLKCVRSDSICAIPISINMSLSAGCSINSTISSLFSSEYLVSIPPIIFHTITMSWERGDNKDLELPSGESSAISTTKLSNSISSRPTNFLLRVPQEIMDRIHYYVDQGQGQLHHDYRTPALVHALIPDRGMYEGALHHYLRTNAHITIQNEGLFLSKPEKEIERLRNLHITWEKRPWVHPGFDLLRHTFNFILTIASLSSTENPRINFFTLPSSPNGYANIQSIIIDFGRNVPGHVNFIFELVSQLPKLRRLGIRFCGPSETTARKNRMMVE